MWTFTMRLLQRWARFEKKLDKEIKQTNTICKYFRDYRPRGWPDRGEDKVEKKWDGSASFQMAKVLTKLCFVSLNRKKCLPHVTQHRASDQYVTVVFIKLFTLFIMTCWHECHSYNLRKNEIKNPNRKLKNIMFKCIAFSSNYHALHNLVIVCGVNDVFYDRTNTKTRLTWKLRCVCFQIHSKTLLSTPQQKVDQDN